MVVRMAALCGALAALALAACQPLANMANSPTAEARHTTYEVPLDGATSADLIIGSVVSAIHIQPLDPSSPLLLTAELGYIGELTTTAEGAEDRTVTITDELNNASYNGPPLAFTIGLNRLPAVRLNVSSSSGDVNLNLRNFNVNALAVSTASGAVSALLPAGSGLYPVNALTASGDIEFTLADNAAVQFQSISTASGDIRITAGNGGDIAGTMVNSSSGDITLTFPAEVTAGFRIGTSSGNITIHVPDGLPVRLEVVSNASGTVNVPASMTQVQGQSDLGVWQTAGYPETGPRVEIIITSTASGDVTIQQQ
ncbi:MAG: DUF4097 family beta strand repeat protein [Anaerolineae bacterium]|nr:DUF4097 family beta strand repeat protein [Anaerolineae bacterium]